jgi:hypothetical protein
MQHDPESVQLSGWWAAVPEVQCPSAELWVAGISRVCPGCVPEKEQNAVQTAAVEGDVSAPTNKAMMICFFPEATVYYNVN